MDLRLLLPLVLLGLLLSCSEGGKPGEGADRSGGDRAPSAWETIATPPGLQAQGDTRDLILISVDTLRADRLPFYGGQNATAGDPQVPFTLAWLAEQSTIFDAVWAPAGTTRPSTCTLWTGQSPLEHGVVSNYVILRTRDTFARRLKRSGWKTHAFVANGVLGKKSGLSPGFHSYRALLGKQEPTLPSETLAAAKPEIAAGQRMLLWTHFMTPHQPYTPPPELADRFTQAEGPEADWEYLCRHHATPDAFDEAERERLRAVYDAEVLHSAEMIHELLTGLEASYQEAGRGSLLDNALVVFTSDHGEELADRYGYFTHAKSLFAGVTRVPFFIAGRGWEAGHRVDANLSLADVFPLLLDGQAPADDLCFSSYQHQFFVARDSRWTLVHNPGENAHGPLRKPNEIPYFYPTVALYDRSQDPLEKVDLSAQYPQETRRLLDALSDWYRDLTLAAMTEEEVLSAEELEMLEELGYAGGGGESALQMPVPWPGNSWEPGPL